MSLPQSAAPPLQRLVVIGAGGCAREVEWLIDDINRERPTFDVLGYVISDLSKVSEYDSRDRILGDFDWLRRTEHAFDAIALGVGFPAARVRLASELQARFPSKSFPSLVHPSVLFDRKSCRFDEGTIVSAGSIVTVNVHLLPFVLINRSCNIGHEVTIGAGCVVNPMVAISGGVQVGDGVLVGTGAKILQYLRVGDGATVGAGAVVTKNVPPGDTVVGVPARTMPKKG